MNGVTGKCQSSIEDVEHTRSFAGCHGPFRHKLHSKDVTLCELFEPTHISWHRVVFRDDHADAGPYGEQR